MVPKSTSVSPALLAAASRLISTVVSAWTVELAVTVSSYDWSSTMLLSAGPDSVRRPHRARHHLAVHDQGHRPHLDLPTAGPTALVRVSITQIILSQVMCERMVMKSVWP